MPLAASVVPAAAFAGADMCSLAWRAANGRRGPGTGLAVRIGQFFSPSSVAGEGAGADADAQHGAGEGFQLAVRCGGQVAGAVTGVDAGDEHDEYGDYCAG